MAWRPWSTAALTAAIPVAPPPPPARRAHPPSAASPPSARPPRTTAADAAAQFSASPLPLPHALRRSSASPPARLSFLRLLPSPPPVAQHHRPPPLDTTHHQEKGIEEKEWREGGEGIRRGGVGRRDKKRARLLRDNEWSRLVVVFFFFNPWSRLVTKDKDIGGLTTF